MNNWLFESYTFKGIQILMVFIVGFIIGAKVGILILWHLIKDKVRKMKTAVTRCKDSCIKEEDYMKSYDEIKEEYLKTANLKPKDVVDKAIIQGRLVALRWVMKDE